MTPDVRPKQSLHVGMVYQTLGMSCESELAVEILKGTQFEGCVRRDEREWLGTKDVIAELHRRWPNDKLFAAEEVRERLLIKTEIETRPPVAQNV